MPVASVRPCAFQPRKDFAEEALRELADSIRAQGILSPLIVCTRGDGFELIAGERRWRAAQLAGLKEVPIIVREADDRAVLELALIENLQRENLNPIEEALGYAQLIEQFQLTQEVAAVKVGKSRAVVANALRLLKLAPELQAYLRHGQLSVGHAKVILGLSGHAEQRLAVERVLKDGLNVRQTEDLVARLQQSSTQAPVKSAPAGKSAAPRDVHVASLKATAGALRHQGRRALSQRQRRGGNPVLQRRRFGPHPPGRRRNNGLRTSSCMKLPVRKYGDPVLRKKGAAVSGVTPEVRQLIADMFETMEANHGVGLAAQQVGHALQLTVIDIRPIEDRPSTLELDGKVADPKSIMPLVLLNPVVKPVGEVVAGSEGCLSFPKLYAEIERPESVDVTATNERARRFHSAAVACSRAASSMKPIISTASSSLTA